MKYILFLITLAVILWIAFVAYEWRTVTRFDLLEIKKENSYIKEQLEKKSELLREAEDRNFNETYDKGK